MKTNKVLISVTPEFRDKLKLEAKSKGFSMTEYTKKLVNDDKGLDCVADGWNKKYKRNMPKGFDFP